MNKKFETLEEFGDWLDNRRWWKHLPYKYNPKSRLESFCSDKWGLYSPSHFVRRGFNGVAQEDVWGLDWYLIRIIPKGIKMLREKSLIHGHPCRIFDENRSSVTFFILKDGAYEEDDDTHWKEQHKLWLETLDNIVAGFEAAEIILNLDYDYENTKQEEHLYETFHKGMKLLCYNFFGMWW
jgi:hypothetical protein